MGMEAEAFYIRLSCNPSAVYRSKVYAFCFKEAIQVFIVSNYLWQCTVEKHSFRQWKSKYALMELTNHRHDDVHILTLDLSQKWQHLIQDHHFIQAIKKSVNAGQCIQSCLKSMNQSQGIEAKFSR